MRAQRRLSTHRHRTGGAGGGIWLRTEGESAFTYQVPDAVSFAPREQRKGTKETTKGGGNGRKRQDHRVKAEAGRET